MADNASQLLPQLQISKMSAILEAMPSSLAYKLLMMLPAATVVEALSFMSREAGIQFFKYMTHPQAQALIQVSGF